MNVRKSIDYSTLFERIDAVLAAGLPQMETCCEIGRLIAERTEKGAAVAVAEHLQQARPDISGFSARNVRRMREFYIAYQRGRAPGFAGSVEDGKNGDYSMRSIDWEKPLRDARYG